jgi:hypothetical protein
MSRKGSERSLGAGGGQGNGNCGRLQLGDYAGADLASERDNQREGLEVRWRPHKRI